MRHTDFFKKTLGGAFLALFMVVSWALPAQAQWTNLTHAPSFHTFHCLLLTDGTVMCHEYNTKHWHRLVPDQNGSYLNGTWDPAGKTIADMPDGTDTSAANPPKNTITGPCSPCEYGPTFYGSAVLPDGRVVVIGGEYNTNGNTWTNIGFMYDPVANSWSSQLTVPFTTGNVGDTQTVVLKNGTMLMANISNSQIASYNPATKTFTTINPTGKADDNDEEGWHILPNGKILTVDATVNNQFELFDPATNKWTQGMTAGVTIGDIGGNCNSAEVGPGLMRPDGTLVYFSGAPSGQNVVYDTVAGTFSHPAGIDFPQINGEQYTVADGPAALLPDGHLLVQASPACKFNGTKFTPFNTPSHYFEWDGTNLTQVGDAANNGSFASYQGEMLVLPTGEILYTAFDQGSTQTTQLYSNGGTFQDNWRPVITGAPKSLAAGTTYAISGKLFNGLSEGAAYGDDAQMSTNYPIVRITNRATHHVFYARTHDHSRMGVETIGSSEIITTQFDTPDDLEDGLSDIEVVANGIPSVKWAVNGPGLTLSGPLTLESCVGSTVTAILNVCNTGKEDLNINNITSSNPQFSVDNPGFTVVISPDFCFPFQAHYTPTSPTTLGPLDATFSIASNDPNLPVASEPVSGISDPPTITVVQVNNGVFPNVCPGSFSDAPVLVVANASQCPLNITNLTAGGPNAANFTLPTVNPTPEFPLVVSGHSTLALPIRFQEPMPAMLNTVVPAAPRSGTIQIASNDPAHPLVSMPVSGFVPAPKLNATIAANGNFGNVCSGNQGDLNLTLINQGECNLNVTAINPTGNFLPPTVGLPLILSHDASVNMPIRFTPTGVCSDTTPQTGSIQIVSNNPDGTFNQPLSGIEGCPKIVLSPANLTGIFAFPPTVSDPTGNLGCYTDRQITVSNAGSCPLTVTNAVASPSDTFNVVNPQMPLTIGPGAAPVPVTIRFKPTNMIGQLNNAPDQQTGALTLFSNDPVGPMANLCGEPTVRSGFRLLVTDGTSTPLASVSSITLSSKGLSPQFSQKVTNATPVLGALCGNPPGSLKFDWDNETLPPAGTTGSNPKASYTLDIKATGKPISQSFTLGQCDFKTFTIQYK